jgi:hypothetical protein
MSKKSDQVSIPNMKNYAYRLDTDPPQHTAYFHRGAGEPDDCARSARRGGGGGEMRPSLLPAARHQPAWRPGGGRHSLTGEATKRPFSKLRSRFLRIFLEIINTVSKSCL